MGNVSRELEILRKNQKEILEIKNTTEMKSAFDKLISRFGESTLHMRWPKYWSFSFSIGPSKDYSRLISFRIDWTLKSPLTPQFKSIKSLALSFHYRPTLTSIHDYWKNQSFD